MERQIQCPHCTGYKTSYLGEPKMPFAFALFLGLISFGMALVVTLPWWAIERSSIKNDPYKRYGWVCQICGKEFLVFPPGMNLSNWKSFQDNHHSCLYSAMAMLAIIALLGGLFCVGALIYYFFVPVGVPDPITHITMYSNDQKFSNMEPGLIFAIICLAFAFITFFALRKRRGSS